jgi:hypothetical protein
MPADLKLTDRKNWKNWKNSKVTWSEGKGNLFSSICPLLFETYRKCHLKGEKTSRNISRWFSYKIFWNSRNLMKYLEALLSNMNVSERSWNFSYFEIVKMNIKHEIILGYSHKSNDCKTLQIKSNIEQSYCEPVQFWFEKSIQNAHRTISGHFSKNVHFQSA